MQRVLFAPALGVVAVVLSWTAQMSNESFAADPVKAFEARKFNSGDESLDYRLLKPMDYDAAQKYPLVLFLHGAGERGSDNRKQLVHGMKEFATDEAMTRRPCFVAAPQCPSGQKWVNVDWSAREHIMPEKPSDSLQLCIKLLDQLEKEFSIDRDRIYITGLSMGGYGVWDAVQRYPKRFAAAVPICGGGDPMQVEQFAKLPIWVFHGARDGVVKPHRSREMVEAIKKAGGEPKYTEYPKAGHDSWSATYRDPKMHEWLFDQRRSD